MTSPKIPASLGGAHLRTYEAIFRQPVSRDLAWRDVHAMFRQLGQVTEEPNGNLKIVRHGQTLVLLSPRTKDVTETSELVELRHFLERSENPVPAPASPGKEDPWLLVIDHRKARIFRSTSAGSIPVQILPHQPVDYFKPTHNAAEFSRGREKPDPGTYFGAVAGDLKTAGKILVFGSGKGSGSEMEQFVTWLKRHHPELARRVVGTLVVDESHLSDAQLLACARLFIARPAATEAERR